MQSNDLASRPTLLSVGIPYTFRNHPLLPRRPTLLSVDAKSPIPSEGILSEGIPHLQNASLKWYHSNIYTAIGCYNKTKQVYGGV